MVAKRRRWGAAVGLYIGKANPHPMIVLPRFVYRLVAHPLARTVADVLLFAVIFVFIVMYLSDFENAPVQ